MGDAIGVLMSVMLVIAVCASFGYNVAKDQGRNPIKFAIICAVLPLVGVGLLTMLKPKSNR
jgi:hypothetical protein